VLKINIETADKQKASPNLSIVDNTYATPVEEENPPIGESLRNIPTSEAVPSDEPENNHFLSATQSDSKNKITWYALRAAYGTELKYRDLFIEKGFEAYVPMIYQKKEEKGNYDTRTIVVRKVRKPVNNLLFVKASRVQLDDYVRKTGSKQLPHLHYYFDHTGGLPRGMEKPITVSESEMRNFRRVADADDIHVEMVSPDDCRFKDGDFVLVKEGRFKGVVGRVARVHRQQRVLVGAGCFMIATSYIPTKFFEKLPQD